MPLRKGYDNIRANVVERPDVAAFIIEHMNDKNATYHIGGSRPTRTKKWRLFTLQWQNKKEQANLLRYIPRNENIYCNIKNRVPITETRYEHPSCIAPLKKISAENPYDIRGFGIF